MKICMISGSLPTTKCGVGDFTGQLAKKINQSGHELTLLTSSNQKLDTYPGIDIVAHMPHWRLSQLKRLIDQIKLINPNIIHIQYPSKGYGRGLAINLLFPLLRLILPNIKSVITLHEYAMFSIWGKIRLWITLISADQVICTNSYDQEIVGQWIGSKKSQVIPLGSCVGEKNSDIISEQVRPACVQLVHFGTVMPNKGWETIIGALIILQQSHIEFSLSVIASLEPDQYHYHKIIAQKIKEAKLEKQIKFLGYLAASQIKLLMEKDDIVLMPFTEGVKLNRSSFITMLGYHKAIITTDTGMTLEHIEPQASCWMIPVNDPQALANAIERLWQEPDLCVQLQQGAKLAYQNFTWSVIREKTLDLYHSIN